jgi:thiamine biosynthesis protein ThiS
VIQQVAKSITISLNEDPRQLAGGTTIADLLAELGLTAKHVAVEVNLELIPRSLHAERRLADGDRLEIVTLVGGG